MLLIKYSFIAFIILSMISGFFESDSDSKLPKSILGKFFYYSAFIAGLAFFAGVIAWAWTKFFSLKSLLVIACTLLTFMALLFLLIFSMFNIAGRSEKLIRRLQDFYTTNDQIHIQKISPSKDQQIKKYSNKDYYKLKPKEQEWYINESTAYIKDDLPLAEPDIDITEHRTRAKLLGSTVQIPEHDSKRHNIAQYNYLLTHESIYELYDQNAVTKIYNWNQKTFSNIAFCLDINDQYFIMITDGDRSKSFEKSVWQVSKKDFSFTLVAKDAYRPADIPPQLVQPTGTTKKILIIYTESLEWGYGGNCSRPKFSKIVLFSEEYKQGLELATFSFSAGTVMDIEYDIDKNTFSIFCDPSRPSATNKKNSLLPNMYSLRIN